MTDKVRLIDANALKKDLTRFYDNEVTARELIDEQPTIEVQPVKHARWEICCDGYYPYCSNCKNEPQGREMTDFCPNCGARMDGDSDDQP